MSATGAHAAGVDRYGDEYDGPCPPMGRYSCPPLNRPDDLAAHDARDRSAPVDEPPDWYVEAAETRAQEARVYGPPARSVLDDMGSAEQRDWSDQMYAARDAGLGSHYR